MHWGARVAERGIVCALVLATPDQRAFRRHLEPCRQHPGIHTHMLDQIASDITLVVMVNRCVAQEMTPILERLFEEGRRHAPGRVEPGPPSSGR